MPGLSLRIVLLCVVAFLAVSVIADVKKTRLDVRDSDVVTAAEVSITMEHVFLFFDALQYVMEELRPLCAYCSPIWKEAYEGLKLVRIISAESAVCHWFVSCSY